LIGAFLLITTAVFGLHVYAKYILQCEWKHLDYRAMAEGLRVQLFWKIIGNSELVTEHYLRKQHSVLDWIRYAIRSVELLRPKNNALVEEANDDRMLRLTKEVWIEGQRDYFHNTLLNKTNDERKFNRLVKGMMWGGFGLSLLLLIIHFQQDILIVLNHLVGKSLIVVITLLFAGAGMIKAYLETKAVKEEIKLYSFMHSMFSIAAQKLNDAQNDRKMQDRILVDLGVEALRENGDWLQLHRARPIEMRVGG